MHLQRRLLRKLNEIKQFNKVSIYILYETDFIRSTSSTTVFHKLKKNSYLFLPSVLVEKSPREATKQVLFFSGPTTKALTPLPTSSFFFDLQNKFYSLNSPALTPVVVY